jgi:hypothetical protein
MKEYKYNAFISYRHSELDKYVAENLHKLIETYKMPKQVVEKYYKKSKSYVYYLARMQPALVEYNKLDKISKELSRITKEKIDLKENDKKIIQNIYEKIEL